MKIYHFLILQKVPRRISLSHLPAGNPRNRLKTLLFYIPELKPSEYLDVHHAALANLFLKNTKNLFPE